MDEILDKLDLLFEVACASSEDTAQLRNVSHQDACEAIRGYMASAEAFLRQQCACDVIQGCGMQGWTWS
jgi:hypothetical protein